MNLVRENKYKGSLKTRFLKKVLSLGIVGTMMFSFTGCNGNKVETVELDKVDYSIAIVKDINDKLQTIVLDPREGFSGDRLGVFLQEYYTQELFVKLHFDSEEDLSEKWESVIAENTACEYVDTIELKPLLVAEYGYKIEYNVNEIDELIAKIRKEPGKYIDNQASLEEANAKLKSRASQ